MRESMNRTAYKYAKSLEWTGTSGGDSDDLEDDDDEDNHDYEG
jgi:hypothetical protein